MKVMSGFRKGESRYVATEHVRFPGTHQAYIDKCTKYIIPNYGTYVKDQQCHLGDKTVAATKLLYHVIPHLVETVLQCGYWFIHNYPDHPLASLLKVSKKYFAFTLVLYCTIEMFSLLTKIMYLLSYLYCVGLLQGIPGYARDSYAARQELHIRARTRTDMLLTTMNLNVATALSSVREEVNSIGTLVGRYQGTLQHQERMFQQENRVLRATLQKVVNRQDAILEVMQ